MPIYAYRCSDCGFQKDKLQKISDPPLTTCPECGKETFNKQVTAAGFQLKGSGWYVTDFRDGGGAGSGDKAKAKTESKSDSGGSAESASGGGVSTSIDSPPKAAPASGSSSTE